MTSTSSSVIDHIMTTCPDLHSRSDVVETTISDHYLIYTVLNSKPNFKNTKYIYCRSFKNFDKASFLNELEQSLVEFSYNPLTDLELAWHKWSTIFSNISNKYVPLKYIRVRDCCNPWMNKTILEQMYSRDHAHD